MAIFSKGAKFFDRTGDFRQQISEVDLNDFLSANIRVIDDLEERVLKRSLGSFLCLSNYQEDPWIDTFSLKGKILFGGRSIELPARSSLILPLDVQLDDDLKLSYSTTELKKIQTGKNQIVLHFSSGRYVKIESNIYQVDETPEVVINPKDVFLNGNTLNLIRKG
jgi:hypothetical protein